MSTLQSLRYWARPVGAIVVSGALILGTFSATSIAHDRALPIADSSDQPATTCQKNDKLHNNTYSYRLSSGKRQRTYLVHTPSYGDFTEPQPVIFAFGGKGMGQHKFEHITQLNRLPALIVYPQPMLGRDNQRAWQGAPYSSKANDVSFIQHTLSDVSQRFCINSDAVFSVGFSNGGGLSWMLSCDMSEQFRAFAMIAGAYYYPENKCHPKKARSVLNIHGYRDTVIPYNGSKKKHLPSIDSWIAHRATTNKCDDVLPAVDYFMSGIRSETWNHCQDDTVVINIEMQNTGHTWPLLINNESSTDFITTTQYVWQFFQNS